MKTGMNGSQRIVVNAMATYGRSLVGAALALFSGRWVLHGLGQTNYGLFSVVGSIIVFVVFLNGILASSVVRHLGHAIGKGDESEVNKWFNAALALHLAVAALLVAIGWPFGNWMVRHVLNIPPQSVDSCSYVFKISLLSAFVNMVSVPFVAMFTAKQRILEIAIWGLLTSLLTFSLAWSIGRIQIDPLRFYATGMVAIIVVSQGILILRAGWIFPECAIRVRQWREFARIKELGAFASWNLIGGSAILLRDQGSAILLNLFFGPSVNASYGIANQVSTQTNQLSIAMVGAFTPEIMASEGRGDRARMLAMANRASKFGTILSLFFALPLMLEMDSILKLWLGNPPEHAAMFCRFILGTFLIDRLTTGTMLAINAKGKIAGYQATVGFLQFLNLPMAWTALHLGAPPTAVAFCFLITMLASTISRAWWARREFGVPFGNWISGVVLPVTTVLAIGLGTGIAFFGMSPNALRTAIVCSASLVGCGIGTWFFGMDLAERVFFLKSARTSLAKLRTI